MAASVLASRESRGRLPSRCRIGLVRVLALFVRVAIKKNEGLGVPRLCYGTPGLSAVPEDYPGGWRKTALRSPASLGGLATASFRLLFPACGTGTTRRPLASLRKPPPGSVADDPGFLN